MDLIVETVRKHPRIAATLLGLTALNTVYKTSSILLQTFVLPGVSLTRFGAKKGSWAVVTGASDGIGKEFAIQLGEAGFNVLLVARKTQVLEAIAADISSKYAVQTKVHSIDFALADEAAYDALDAAFTGLDIGVLVNNVGKSHQYPINFVDTPKDEIKDIVTINVYATLRVTQYVLPGMIIRKRGLILNVGSFAGAIPSPMLATYSGTKAFLTTWTAAIADEVKEHNIVVENLNTYFIVSKLSKYTKPTAMIPMPAPYVRAVLAKIGLACGAAHTRRPNTSTPYWAHALFDYVLHLCPSPSFLVRFSHNIQKKRNVEYLRQMEKQSKAE